MHRARITLNMVTSMNETELEEWASELAVEGKSHLLEMETINRVEVEVEATGTREPWNNRVVAK